MNQPLATLDWLVIVAYLAGIMGLAIWLSRGQHSREDYYVGGRHIGAWPVALSIMATQCSTNSILGAPAFVAFAVGGGLVWLQYELAVPLAMIVLMLLFMPVFRDLKLVSVYAYLEQRYDLRTRLVLSGLFLFVRAFATAVTVYSIALVIELITGMSFFWAVLLLGLFTIVYDIFGGIQGVIYSDVIQLLILTVVLMIVLTSLATDAGGLQAMMDSFAPDRRMALDFAHHGLGDGHTFAFWPMLFGGFFLYVSYYGCDQSQVQRTLSTRSIDETNHALFLNGLLRFPLVALYCLVGVGIGVFATGHPEFLEALPTRANEPQLNLTVPVYMLQALPAGVAGLAMVALFAAAMSSLDSVINSLSATTMEDFVRRFHKGDWSDARELTLSRWLTIFWGGVTLALSFYVGDIAPTVLEAINKIGSLANGSILAVFVLGLMTRQVTGSAVSVGLVAGMAVNGWCWIAVPELSWLWWNPLGFFVTCFTGLILSSMQGENGRARTTQTASLATCQSDIVTATETFWRRRSYLLCAWFVLLLVVLTIL